jgi:hypothetical protein
MSIIITPPLHFTLLVAFTIDFPFLSNISELTVGAGCATGGLYLTDVVDILAGYIAFLTVDGHFNRLIVLEEVILFTVLSAAYKWQLQVQCR